MVPCLLRDFTVEERRQELQTQKAAKETRKMLETQNDGQRSGRSTLRRLCLSQHLEDEKPGEKESGRLLQAKEMVHAKA